MVKNAMKTIPAGEFKAKCLKLMERVRTHGETYLVTKRNEPVAKLCPLEPSDDGRAQRPLFGSMKGTFEIAGDVIGPFPEAWEAPADGGTASPNDATRPSQPA